MSKTQGLTPHNIASSYLDNEESEIGISDQCRLLGISRASAYYQPVPVSEEDLDLMSRIDEIHTRFPTYGTRPMSHQLTEDVKYLVGRKRTGRLMKTMGIEAIYPKSRLSFNGHPHQVFPYLLKDVSIVRPNHVWSADITYIRTRFGFLYMVVFLDWYARYVLSWQLSDSLKADFCLEAADMALKINVPDIVNFDQGVQFTDEQMISKWNNNHTKISMDHKGRCFDNIFTERFWRTLKYDEVYLKEYTTYHEARESIGGYIGRYNNQRLHQSLHYKTPATIYFKG